MDEQTWKRASQPVINQGGLDIREKMKLAPICYAAFLDQFGQLAESLVDGPLQRFVIQKATDDAIAKVRPLLDPGPLPKAPSQHTLDEYRCTAIT